MIFFSSTLKTPRKELLLVLLGSGVYLSTSQEKALIGLAASTRTMVGIGIGVLLFKEEEVHQQFHFYVYILKNEKQGPEVTCTPMFTTALLTIIKRWKKPSIH